MGRGTRSAVWLLAFLLMGLAAGGEELPLTLQGETAFTLSRGEWLIGGVKFPLEGADIARLELHLGLTDSLQLGTRPIALLLGIINGEVKYGMRLGGGIAVAADVWMAIPISFTYLGLGGGGYLSFPGQLAWHAGAEFSVLPELGFSANLASDFSLLPWLHFLGEGSFPPPRIAGGILARLGGFGLLRAVVGVEYTGAEFVPYSYLEFFALFGLR